MSPAAAQLQFGAEFLGFLAAVAGVALALLRTGSRRLSPIVAAGLTSVALASFLAGSRLVDPRSGVLISAPRVAGAVVIAVGALAWRTDKRVRFAMVAGAVATGLAAVFAGLDLGIATDAFVALGAVGIGLASIDQARRSLASRIAVSSAATLLVLVLVLAVALSGVVDTNLRHEATRRLDLQAKAESQNVNILVANALRFGYLANDDLLVRQTPDKIAAQAASGKADASFARDLADITKLYTGQAYLYVTAGGQVLDRAGLQTVSLDKPGLVALIGSDLVQSTTCTEPKVAILVIRGQAFGTSAVATCTRDRTTVLGRFVALTPLDDSYLEGRHRNDPTISFSFIASGVPVAASGAQPPPAEVRRIATEVQDAGRQSSAQASSNNSAGGKDPHSATVGDRFLSAVAIDLSQNEPPNLVLVASSPTSTILATQNRLFRTLFLIALVGALAALLLASAIGERIGSRLRRLTAAAAGISRGDPGVRAGLEGDDEVGTLGATFDAMATSIEEKTAAETALRGRIEAVVAGMAEALVATDADACITDFNQAAEDLIGVSASTALGREVLEVVALAADDGTDLQARLKKPPRTRWTASGILHPVDGPPVPVAVSGGPLRDAAGALVGGVVLLRDLRGEREVERMKTEFLSRIGHELRTPLTGVLGYADLLLRREWPPERSRTMLEEVHASARRLERIVELLEFFAAAAAGRTLLRLRELDIRVLVDGVYRSWEPRVDPPAQLARKLSRSLPRVIGDPRWLRMALDEMVDNANKFSPGGGRIVIGAQQIEDGRVEVFVADHGVGMSPDEVTMAFDDFAQGDTSDTRSFGGLGLGLPLVQRVAEGHGGEVRCATTPGRGTRLSILLSTVKP